MTFRSIVAAAAAGTALLCGCDTFKKSEETVGTVGRRVTGMAVGDFLDRYGRARTRTETADGGALYDWESEVEASRPGFATGVDGRTCRLRVSSDRRGRITGAVILFDGQGRTGTSRCREIFAAP